MLPLIKILDNMKSMNQLFKKTQSIPLSIKELFVSLPRFIKN